MTLMKGRRIIPLAVLTLKLHFNSADYALAQFTLVNVGHTNNGGFALSVAVSGNYVYLANDADGLRVYDISNPTNAVNVGHTTNGGYATRVAVSGNYAYLANWDDGL